MRVFMPTALLLTSLLSTFAAESCDESSAALSLSSFAHTSNEEFIAKVTSGQARQFRPQILPATIDAKAMLTRIDLDQDRFLTYHSDNGWNNQVLNLLCALDMARLLNRTLIVPPFRWVRRRGDASVSVGRLVDLRALASFGVRVLCDDEAGSVSSVLKAAGVAAEIIAGEGQPHRKKRMPRWSREQWQLDGTREPRASARLLTVTCCLFWTWALLAEIALEVYGAFAYHPFLVNAATAAAAPLGDSYAAMHVRRGDKATVDVAYRAVFGSQMSTSYFRALALHGDTIADGSRVFVATDELDRSWFGPLRDAGSYTLSFVDDLHQPPLLAALSAFPQPLWADVLAILEQIICARAPSGFVGSLPSTLSGHIVNVRAAAAHEAAGGHEAAGASEARSPPLLFTKLHESCCDERTTRDWLNGGLVGGGGVAALPCVTHAGNPWC